MMSFLIYIRTVLEKNLKVLGVIVSFLVSSTGHAQSVTVSGTDWTVSPTAIIEAGENYAGTYESAVNQILVSMSIPGVVSIGGSATVSVHYEPNTLWNANLILNGMRTGDGTNGSICVLCSLSNGTVYQPITATATSFFTLTTGIGVLPNTRNNIPIRLKLSGVSVTIPVANYKANVVFTISN